MRRTSFRDAECPIARGVDQVGDWWSLLILRDALGGLTRFDQFERSLGIAPAMLTKRLRALVDSGLLERRPYAERPVRHEYVLTDRGRDFRAVLLAFYAWSERQTPADDLVMLPVDRDGTPVDPVLVDRATGRPLDDLGVRFAPGPAASPALHHRLTRPIKTEETR